MESISIILNLSKHNSIKLNFMLKSLQKQTYCFENIELILLDNNLLSSNEKTILKNNINQYKNIKFISIDVHSNLNQVYNIAMKFVSSNYVMFLDSNALFLENSLQILYNNIKKNMDVIIGNCINLPLNINIKHISEENYNDFNKYLLDFSDFPLEKYIEPKDINFKLFSTIFLKSPKIYKTSFIKENNIFNSKNFEETILSKLTKIIIIDEPIIISQDILNSNETIGEFHEKNNDTNLKDYLPNQNSYSENDNSKLKPHIRAIIIDSKTNGNLSSNTISKLLNNIPTSILIYNPNFINELNTFIKDIEEEFICILYNGDLIEENMLKYFEEDFKSKNMHNTGAIIFDNVFNKNGNELQNLQLGFSPELYLETDYIHNSVLINKDILLKYGGFNPNFKTNFIRDAILKFYDDGYEIIKEDKIGFRINKIFYDSDENELFLNETLKRRNCQFKINKDNNILKPIYNTDNKKASIIIPFKDQIEVTKVCINSILDKTTYKNYEIILINNNSYEKETFEYLEQISSIPNIKIINYLDTFNWSKINNFGVKHSSGEVFVFLNNDTEIISPNWLTQLVGDSIQKNVGSVGAKLFFEDGTIQHAGIVLGLHGLAGHLFAGECESNIPELYDNHRRNVSAVTGACMAINKKVFEEIKGFDETFEVNFSDIEICLRLLKKGYRNIYNPNIKLTHYEWKTKGKNFSSDHDRILCYNSFKPYLNSGDPFFNKNLSLKSNTLLLKNKNESHENIINSFWDNFFNIKNQKITKINQIEAEMQIDQNIIKYNLSENDMIKNEILMNKFFNNRKLKIETILWFFPSFKYLSEKDLFTIFKIADYLSLKENSYHIFVLDDFEASNDKVSDMKNKFINLNFESMSLADFNNKKPTINTDIGFCVNWSSAFNLVKYNNCTTKFYFVPSNDLSTDFDLKKFLIEETYKFNFIGITNSTTQRKKYKQHNKHILYFTPFFDKNKYFAPKNKIIEKDVKNILFYGNPNDSEFELCINILKIIKKYFKHHVEIFSIGTKYDIEDYNLEDVLTNLGNIESNNELSEIYRKTDLVLMFMNKDLTKNALEILASGCILITNVNEYTQNLLKHNENVILTKPFLNYAVEDIINILSNGILRNRIFKNSLKSINVINEKKELDNLIDYIKSPL